MMRMILDHKLSVEDIRFIVKNTWARGKQEAEACGYYDEEAWVKHFQEMSSEYGYCLKVDGEPMAMFGAVEINDIYYTYFAATERFNALGVRATIFITRFLRERTAERPDKRLELGSACSHPLSRDWFEVIGFEHIETKGIFSRYFYSRKFKSKLT